MENNPAREEESGQSLPSRLRSTGRRVLEYARNPHETRLQIERRREQWVGFEAVARALEKTDGVARYKRDMGRKAVAYFQENILLETPRDHPEYFEEKLHEYAATGEYWPIILGTHKAHPAGFPLIEEAKYIGSIFNQYPGNDRITGSLLLIALTMKGGQNEDIVKYLERAEPIFKKFNTLTALVARKKDVEEGHIDASEVQEYNRKLYKQLSNVVASGQIPLILPEGTVQSGRQKDGGAPGEINGMVYLPENTVAGTAKLVGKQGKKPLFILMGTTGENRIYNPIIGKITSEAMVTAVVRDFELGRQHVPPIMSSVVDYPVSLEEIEQQYNDGKELPKGMLELIIGHVMARLLPPNERGDFAEDTFVDQYGLPSGRRNTDSLWS